jgi:hypothetical protein
MFMGSAMSMVAEPRSIAAIAVELGLNRRTTAALCEKIEPVSGAGPTRRWFTADVVQVLLDQARKKKPARELNELERVRLERARFEFEQMKRDRAIRARQLVEAESVRLYIRNKMIVVKQNVRALPSRVAMMIDPENPVRVHAILLGEIDDMLNRLADDGPPSSPAMEQRR